MSTPTGEFDGRTHRFPVRVYFEDTDAAGIVYYANYLRYVERARTELLRLAGREHSTLMAGDNGVAFAVRHCEADYLKPARLDDILEVVTSVRDVRGASMVMDQLVRRGGEDLVSVSVKLACIKKDGRPARIPADVRENLKNMENGILRG